MSIRNQVSGFALVVLVAGASTAALAQTPAPLRPEAQAISMDDARRIAAEHGMVRVEEIELDNGKWQIEGRDSMGGEIEIDLSASDGAVLKMERERPVSARATPN